SPIGRHFIDSDKPVPDRNFEIVGVVKDSKYFNIRQAVEPMIYVPLWRFFAGGNTLCIRSTGRPEQLIGAVRHETANIDPAIPVLQSLTMEEQFDNVIAQER